MLLRKPQITEERVHFLQSAQTSPDFFNFLSQIVGDVSNKDSLERNLDLSLLRCVVARRWKETTQLFKCYCGMCLGVLVPHPLPEISGYLLCAVKLKWFWTHPET